MCLLLLLFPPQERKTSLLLVCALVIVFADLTLSQDPDNPDDPEYDGIMIWDCDETGDDGYGHTTTCTGERNFFFFYNEKKFHSKKNKYLHTGYN